MAGNVRIAGANARVQNVVVGEWFVEGESGIDGRLEQLSIFAFACRGLELLFPELIFPLDNCFLERIMIGQIVNAQPKADFMV